MDSVERNDVFELAFRFVTETLESIFLTGKAGTGKTTFLKYLKENCAKNIIVAAPTGVAAINAGGVTLHSLFQLPLRPFLPSASNRQQLLKDIRYNKQRINLLKKVELLVIDEISMVRCDVLDAVDTILKSVRRNHNAPFGGVQLLFIGDLFQLPPVAKNEEWRILGDYYTSPFFFDSIAVKEQQPLLIELTEVYRQREAYFVTLLNKVRNNQLDQDDFETLNARYQPGFIPAEDEKYITLTSHNNQADQVNQQKLNQLIKPAFTYKARTEDDFPESIYPAEAELVLKEGTQVMFIKNDPVNRKYFNGKIGVVTSLSANRIVVSCDGEDIEVVQEVWENIRYTLNRADEKLEQQVLGRFFQYPLRLAWAITIHKSQGLTFDKVMIDASSSFSSGQVYVALSRCTSLDGIVLLSKIPPAAIYSSEAIVSAQASLTPKGSLAERFSGARMLFSLQLLSGIFLLDELEQNWKQLLGLAHKFSSTLQPAAIQWTGSLYEALLKERNIAEKFMSQVQELFKETPVIEENVPLQKRIRDAAHYFLPRMQQWKEQLTKHPLYTEHKETAVAIDECLADIHASFIRAEGALQFCLEPFSIAGFLKYKLSIGIPRTSLSSYAAKKSAPISDDTPNAALYYELRNWRDKICRDEEMPVYLVANNNSLKEISTYLPLTTDHLQQLNGFGKAKASRFGEAILEMVRGYCDQHNLETAIELKQSEPKRQRKESVKPVAPKEAKIPSANISLDLYRQGKSIAEIARERNLSAGTIEGHLLAFIKTGEVGLDVFADAAAAQTIIATIKSNPDKKHAELRLLLNEAYSFTQIKAVAAHLEAIEKNNIQPV